MSIKTSNEIVIFDGAQILPLFLIYTTEYALEDQVGDFDGCSVTGNAFPMMTRLNKNTFPLFVELAYFAAYFIEDVK